MRVTAMVAAIALVSGCGSGGGGQSAVPSTGSASGGTSSNNKVTFSVPTTFQSSSSRSAANLNSAGGIVFYVYPVSGTAPTSLPSSQCSSSTPFSTTSSGGGCIGDVAASPSSGNTSLCTGGSCTIAFSLSPGTYVISLQLYSSEPTSCPSACTIATSSLVATGTTTTTINANGSNSINLTINSVAGTISTSSGWTPGPFTPGSNATTGVQGGQFTVSILPGSVPANATASVSELLTFAFTLSNARSAQSYTSGGTFVYGLNFTLTGVNSLTSPFALVLGTQSSPETLKISSSGSLASKLSGSGFLNVAAFSNGSLNDVGSVNYSYSAGSPGTLSFWSVNASGVNTSGISTSGIYIIYLPPPSVTSPPAAPAAGSVLINGSASALTQTLSSSATYTVSQAGVPSSTTYTLNVSGCSSSVATVTSGTSSNVLTSMLKQPLSEAAATALAHSRSTLANSNVSFPLSNGSFTVQPNSSGSCNLTITSSSSGNPSNTVSITTVVVGATLSLQWNVAADKDLNGNSYSIASPQLLMSEPNSQSTYGASSSCSTGCVFMPMQVGTTEHLTVTQSGNSSFTVAPASGNAGTCSSALSNSSPTVSGGTFALTAGGSTGITCNLTVTGANSVTSNLMILTVSGCTDEYWEFEALNDTDGGACQT
jgi:hypothetical protein